MNGAAQNPISPEIIQAIIAQAGARGLSVNEYLRQMLGLSAQPQELALAEDSEVRPNEAMLAVQRETAEILKTMAGSRSTEYSLSLLHEARAGAMFGYDPTQ